jgi:hypothetical protein
LFVGAVGDAIAVRIRDHDVTLADGPGRAIAAGVGSDPGRWN